MKLLVQIIHYFVVCCVYRLNLAKKHHFGYAFICTYSFAFLFFVSFELSSIQLNDFIFGK